LQGDPVVNIKEWGKKNPKDFYNIAAKLIPTEISGGLNITKIGLDLAEEICE
jgi:hypothetical protein